MINNTQTDELKRAAKEQFVEKVTKKFTPKDLISVKYHRSRMVKMAAYFPNIVSVSTSGFAIWFFTQDYNPIMRIIFLVLGGLFLIGLEFIKRLWLAKGYEGYFQKSTPLMAQNFLPLILLVCPISMFLSYHGGDSIVHESNDVNSIVIRSPQVDSIQNLIAKQDSLIAFESTQTWKGQIRREAAKAKLLHETKKAQLEDQLFSVQQEDKAQQNILRSEKKERIVNFGIVFGCVALGADLLLFVMFGISEKDEFDVYLYAQKTNNKKLAKQVMQGPIVTNTQAIAHPPHTNQAPTNARPSQSVNPLKSTLTQPLQAPTSPVYTQPLQGNAFEFASPDEWDELIKKYADARSIGDLTYSIKNTEFGATNGKIKHAYISQRGANKGERVVIEMSPGSVRGRVKQYAIAVEKYKYQPSKELAYKNNSAWLAYWQKRLEEFTQ